MFVCVCVCANRQFHFIVLRRTDANSPFNRRVAKSLPHVGRSNTSHSTAKYYIIDRRVMQRRSVTPVSLPYSTAIVDARCSLCLDQRDDSRATCRIEISKTDELFRRQPSRCQSDPGHVVVSKAASSRSCLTYFRDVLLGRGDVRNVWNVASVFGASR